MLTEPLVTARSLDTIVDVIDRYRVTVIDLVSSMLDQLVARDPGGESTVRSCSPVPRC